jgi:ADP-ribose pyrophosphatase YjhB (NUDIX family)
MEQNLKPRVGIGAMILNEKGEVLLGHRNDDPIKASSDLHGEGCWTFPGGKLDFGETLLDGAAREVLEETSIKVDKEKAQLLSITNEIRPDTHYVTVGFLWRYNTWQGEPKAMEPEEIVEWKWYNLDNLPHNMFLPSAKMIKLYLNKKIYE